MANAVVSNTAPTQQIVTSDGKPNYAMTKWMAAVGQTVNGNFDPNGNYQGPIGTHATIAGRQTLASIVQNIDMGGVVEAAGIDFARAYINKDTDHIADGSGSPLAGGKAAEIALVSSAPAPEAHKWVNGIVGGIFTKTQPQFADVAGVASPAQVPALNTLSGQIDVSQGPAAGVSGTFVVGAKLTPITGNNGTITVVNGIITAVSPAT